MNKKLELWEWEFNKIIHASYELEKCYICEDLKDKKIMKSFKRVMLNDEDCKIKEINLYICKNCFIGE